MAKAKQAGAYRVTSGDYFYLGSTQDFENRRNHHRWALAAGRHCSVKLQAAYDAGGGMKFERLRICDEGLLTPQEMEQELLDFYAGNTRLCNANSSAFGPDEAMKSRARERVADPARFAITRERMAAAKRGARNAKARAVRITLPGGETQDFPCVSDAATFFGVSQQLMDLWIRGVVPWPGTGTRTRAENAWIAAYSFQVLS